jgi:CubicO group peptidase (beta-lactamase class C family)
VLLSVLVLPVACSAAGAGHAAGDGDSATSPGGGSTRDASAASADGASSAFDGGATPPALDAADPYDGSFLDTKEVDDFLIAQMQAAHTAGMAVAIVKGSHVGWAKGYGLADTSKNTPVTPDTLFMLASISKTIVSVALMRLIEDPARGIALDDDVDAKLPFRVRNPSFPDTPITYRMLLTHSSSLVDGAILDGPPVVGDPTESLHDWLADAIGRDDAWASTGPGTTFSYSNTAVSLAGYLVELITGKGLQEYCVPEIFAPLGMSETSWFLRGLDAAHVATPYEYVNGAFQTQGLYGFADYPDGQLRTSAVQLARFLSMFMQGGQYGGVRILKEATVLEMQRLQIPSVDAHQGLIWFYSQDQSTKVLGHNGAYLGVSTDMWFDPATSTGYVLLTNGGTYYDDENGTSPEYDAMSAINYKLMDLAHALP